MYDIVSLNCLSASCESGNDLNESVEGNERTIASKFDEQESDTPTDATINGMLSTVVVKPRSAEGETGSPLQYGVAWNSKNNDAKMIALIKRIPIAFGSVAFAFDCVGLTANQRVQTGLD